MKEQLQTLKSLYALEDQQWKQNDMQGYIDTRVTITKIIKGMTI